jgi:ubiquinone/menaquinone biosynthesis C-methylase UbiE
MRAKAAKSVIKAVVRPAILHWAKGLYQVQRLQRSDALKAFARAGTEPKWLGLEVLEALSREYPPVSENEVKSQYSEQSLDQRAKERLLDLKRTLGPAFRNAMDFLEVGAGDGMIGAALLRERKRSTVSDVQKESLDARATAAGARFLECGAEQLPCEDQSFDVVYSFDAFEHFERPELALQELWRVVRPGGHVYLSFGPLYNSADGMHLGARLGIPYAPILHEKKTIDAFMVSQGKDPINHEYCNGWPLNRYRELFAGFRARFETVLYREHRDLSALELIRRFPTCFRSKHQDIDEFVVALIQVVFRKRA